MQQHPEKNCHSCGKKLQGRSDKKFCNDYCRNAFNNAKKPTDTAVVRNINQSLVRNRRILEQLLGNEKTAKVNKERLVQQGFMFNYHTHTYQNKHGDTYQFCYEMGYLVLEQGWVLIVRRPQ